MLLHFSSYSLNMALKEHAALIKAIWNFLEPPEETRVSPVFKHRTTGRQISQSCCTSK